MSNMKQSNRCVMLRWSKQETDEAKLAQDHTFYTVYLQMKHHFQPPIKHYILASSLICKGLEWSWLTDRSSRPPPGHSLKSVMLQCCPVPGFDENLRFQFWLQILQILKTFGSGSTLNYTLQLPALFWFKLYLHHTHTSVSCTFLVQVLPALHTHF
jgi:hypothetical protein